MDVRTLQTATRVLRIADADQLQVKLDEAVNSMSLELMAKVSPHTLTSPMQTGIGMYAMPGGILVSLVGSVLVHSRRAVDDYQNVRSGQNTPGAAIGPAGAALGGIGPDGKLRSLSEVIAARSEKTASAEGVVQGRTSQAFDNSPQAVSVAVPAVGAIDDSSQAASSSANKVNGRLSRGSAAALEQWAAEKGAALAAQEGPNLRDAIAARDQAADTKAADGKGGVLSGGGEHRNHPSLRTIFDT